MERVRWRRGPHRAALSLLVVSPGRRTGMDTDGISMRQLAFSATVHCLTGCAIGEVLGMVIGTGLRWADGPTVALSVAPAFLFGYSLTLRPLLASGLAF